MTEGRKISCHNDPPVFQLFSTITSVNPKNILQNHNTSGNPETCLLGLKGRLPRQVKNIPKLINSELREHSRKPDEARDRIVSLFGNLPRIELFARKLSRDIGFGIECLEIKVSIAEWKTRLLKNYMSSPLTLSRNEYIIIITISGIGMRKLIKQNTRRFRGKDATDGK
jgi:hypothetical protein